MLAGQHDIGVPPPAGAVDFRRLPAAEFTERVDELIDIYLDAMRYPASGAFGRRGLWRQHAARANFDCVAAVGPDGAALGFVYGYTGGPDQWWHAEVHRGLSPQQAAGLLTDYAELTELHVAPDHQGHHLGEHLLRRFVAGRPEQRVLLSTPEVPGGNRAWRLYRRVGFTDVLRGHRFTGDPRPFGILGLERGALR